MDASKRKADDSLNGTIPDEPATKKANLNESVDDCAKNQFGTVRRGYEAKTTLSLTTTIESLETQQKGEKILVGNHLKWYMYVKRFLKEDCIAVWVCSDDQYKYPLTVNVECSLEGVDQKNSIIGSRKRRYGGDDFFHGVRLLKWDKLLNDRHKFETDGKITVTAKINIRIPNSYFNFDSERLYADVKINIGSKCVFPFNKSYLAGHSEYFNTLFFGPFKESNEEVVKLQGVDRVAFVNLINLVYVHGFKVKMTSIGDVLELADRFGMLAVMDHCEELLLKSERNSEPSLAERLLLAAKYSLDKLKTRCLEFCDSAKIIKEVRKSAIYEEMPDAMKAKLLERIIDVLPPSIC